VQDLHAALKDRMRQRCFLTQALVSH